MIAAGSVQLQLSAAQRDPYLEQLFDRRQHDPQGPLQGAPPDQVQQGQPGQHQEQQDLGDMIARLDRILQGEARPQDSIRVHVGIDEDLKMILDMDPSIVDMVPALPSALPPVLQPPMAAVPALPQQTSPRYSRLPPRG